VDTLGVATPDTVFNQSSLRYARSIQGPKPVYPQGLQYGPRFTIGENTVLTHAGAFLNCIFPPDCPSPLAHVQIHSSAGDEIGGLIDSFTLSHDGDPSLISYESASFRLPLPPGTYFALFGTNATFGHVLGETREGYLADRAVFGQLLVDSSGRRHSSVGEDYSATRVLGEELPSPVPEPATILMVATAALGFSVRRWRRTSGKRF
jgi:hypothetical protein